MATGDKPPPTPAVSADGRLTARGWLHILAHELRGVGRRLAGHDPGVTMWGSTPVTEAGLALRREAAQILIAAPSWAEAVQGTCARWDSATRRKAAAMLGRENFDEFVVFGVRAVTELLRQSVEGPVVDRSDLQDGLAYEARLTELDDAARFDEATRLAPAVAELAPAHSPSLEDLVELHSRLEGCLAPYTRTHGPLPSILLEGAARHLSPAS